MSNKKNILVTGANGQLGMEFKSLANKYPDYNFFFADKNQLSITDQLAVRKYFTEHNFYYCINCAAYTAVDKAETAPALAIEINATAPGNLAAICKEFSAGFIHVSTDYVFDGNGKQPYKETDLTNPLGVYGNSKLQGEHAVLKNNAQALIIRTSWLYSSYGNNFVKTMLRLMRERERISVVEDQYGCPTYAADLAAAILHMLASDKKMPAGIFNYCNEGAINWYTFALEIKKLTGSNCVIDAIPAAAYPTPAKRPSYSVLDTTKIRSTFDLHIPTWKQSLKKCIDLLN